MTGWRKSRVTAGPSRGHQRDCYSALLLSSQTLLPRRYDRPSPPWHPLFCLCTPFVTSAIILLIGIFKFLQDHIEFRGFCAPVWKLVLFSIGAVFSGGWLFLLGQWSLRVQLMLLYQRSDLSEAEFVAVKVGLGKGQPACGIARSHANGILFCMHTALREPDLSLS